MNTDTPLPPEEPAGKNPPDGAIINYYLKSGASGPVILEIVDSANNVVRRFSSADKPDDIEAIGKQVNIPTYWIRPTQILSAGAGMQRFVWDLHYAPLDWLPPQYPISAIYGDTWREPRGPWVQAGNYTVRLTVNGRSYTQPLTVKMDPRVKTSPEALAQQHQIAMKCYEGMKQVREALEQVRKLRTQLRDLRQRAGSSALGQAINEVERKAAALEGAGGGFRGSGTGSGEPSLSRLNGELLGLMGLVEGADLAPTTQAVAGSEQAQRMLAEVLARWGEIKDKDVKPLNEQLAKVGLPVVTY
jgi:hypothetical protein